ncbi:hypothetical protein [Nonomuraea longispora]|nr:hypothetical protein [Nonomuraea longispora]
MTGRTHGRRTGPLRPHLADTEGPAAERMAVALEVPGKLVSDG